jgi:hypothetical protein
MTALLPRDPPIPFDLIRESRRGVVVHRNRCVGIEPWLAAVRSDQRVVAADAGPG